MTMSTDERPQIYDELNKHLLELRPANRIAARSILSILFRYFRPQSLLDVGCGTGSWLAVAGELGIADRIGIESMWLDRSLLEVDSSLVVTHDLEKPFSLGRKFDLVVSLEVAEHLSPSAA